ncbi:FUSC family protein [Nocardiopsis sp. JB363]|uniref:FUSC family protein n=1 Tax=Nocardiopsis sp. JB363 TaxID=1434837 RepID=UPI000979F0D9|nr:FUSC family protein [Nocardiopsis sp. JB363]SIO86358.1 putative integral membrane protein [Nocardiopsis sp. JB363]
MNYFSSVWGRSSTLFDSRGSLSPRRVRGNVIVTAARVGVCLLTVLIILHLAGRMDLAPYAAMGCFTALYARDDTYRRRAPILALVATGLTLSVGAGALTSALSTTMVAPIVVVALVAAAAKYTSDTVRLGAPAGLMFVFAAGVAAYAPQTLAGVPVHTLTTAAAAALCWVMAMVGVLVHPRAAHRLASARALHAVADHLHAPTPARRQGAEAALHRARQVLGATPRTDTVLALEVMIARAHTLVLDGGDRVLQGRRAAELRELARRVRTRRRLDPLVSEEELRTFSAHADQVRSVGAAHPGPAPRMVWAVRIALASLAAGVLAWSLGMGHGYWATVSAASVLQATSVTLTWHRTLQRALGTVAGTGAAAALFAVVDTSSVWVLIIVVVLCQVGAELVVTTNYAYAIVCVTPLTLALSSLAHPGAGASDLVGERLAATVLGAVVGVVVTLLVRDGSMRERVEWAMGECARACRQVEECGMDAGARHRLVDAHARVREALAVAGGETGGRGVPRGRAEAVCERAQALLDRERSFTPA